MARPGQRGAAGGDDWEEGGVTTDEWLQQQYESILREEMEAAMERAASRCIEVMVQKTFSEFFAGLVAQGEFDDIVHSRH